MFLQIQGEKVFTTSHTSSNLPLLGGKRNPDEGESGEKKNKILQKININNTYQRETVKVGDYES